MYYEEWKMNHANPLKETKNIMKTIQRGKKVEHLTVADFIALVVHSRHLADFAFLIKT